MKKLYNELENGSRKGGSSQWAKNIHLHALDTPKIMDKKDLSIFKTGDHKKKKKLEKIRPYAKWHQENMASVKSK